ncbi:hypothetical protein Tco_1482029 [Tanacetum coccineum]
MVAFLQKSTGSEEFHQIVDFLADSHIRYALTANPTIYASLIEQFWQTATVETVNNGEQQLSVTVDGQTIAITEASVRRHLQLADADGISSLPNTEIFEQLTLMGYVSNDDKLTFQKGPSSPGGTQHTSTLNETSPQLQNISNTYRKTRTRTRRMGIRIPQSDVPTSVADEAIIKEMHDGLATSSGPSSPRTSSEGSLGCHFTMGDIPVQARTERVSNLPNKPPLREGNTSRSGEGSMQLLELINLYTKLSDKVTSLEDELASTKAVYNKALITLHQNRVRNLEKQLKHREGRAGLFDISEDEGPSLDAKDSPKQGRMIEEIDKDETINLVKSRELGKSAAKGKAIMQESEPLKKIKKKEMIQISLDEEFAKTFYEEEQAQIMQDEVYAKQVETQWIADEERIP